MRRLINWVYGIIITIILTVCLFFSNTNYYCMKTMNHSNFYYLIIGIISIILLYCLISLFTTRILKVKQLNHLNRVMILCSILFCIIQMIIAYHYFFKTGWDAGLVIESGDKIATHSIGPFENEYYSTYPNNLFLTCVFSIVAYASRIFNTDYYFLLILIQCCIYSYSSYMVYRITAMILDNHKYAVLSWILSILLIGISPWVTIPYSDSFGLFFPVTSVYLLIRIYRKEHILPFLFCLSFISYLGYKIKPQILIFFIALIIIIVPDIKNIYLNSKLNRTIPVVLAGIMSSLLVVHFSIASADITVYPEKSLGLTHFFMMGLNEETNGVFSGQDVELSSSINNQKDRIRTNLAVSKNRIIEFKLNGLTKHLTKKLLTVFNDGSFAWYAEGDFLREEMNNGSPQLRELLESFYLPTGKHYQIFLSIVQTIWLTVLCLCLFACFHKGQLVLKLSVIGLTMFELLFEARARYLLTYAPVFIILSCIGFSQIITWLTFLIQKPKTGANERV